MQIVTVIVEIIKALEKSYALDFAKLTFSFLSSKNNRRTIYRLTSPTRDHSEKDESKNVFFLFVLYPVEMTNKNWQKFCFPMFRLSREASRIEHFTNDG